MAVIVITPALPEDQSVQAGRITEAIAAGSPEAAAALADDAMYRTLMECILEGVLITDSNGRIVDCNGACSDILSMGLDELRCLDIAGLMSGDTAGVMEAVASALEKEPVARIEACLHGNKGDVVSSSILARRLNGESDSGYCFFIRNTGDDRDSDAYSATLKNAQAASTVAGQIAHDFDNLLTPLFSYPELIRPELPKDSKGHHLLDTIEKTASDMKNITQQLLAISRRGRTQLQVFDLNEIIQRVADLSSIRAREKGVEIHTTLDENLLPIEGTPEQMLRVVQNLVQNAVDALEESGRVDIETRNVYLDRPVRHIRELEVGEYVQVRIADNGPGIPYEIREKIFDPFFTTRVGGRKGGSGLGLSVVKGIVTDHHGVVDLRSTAGKGTSFDLYFPAHREIDDLPEVESQGTGDAVLIVDDDPRQRDILSGMFKANGYRVSSVASAERALEVMSERVANSEPDENGHILHNFPDLIVLDAVMDPGMDGREACSRILEMNPRQKIIVVSGYATPDEIGIGRMLGTISYLRKPVIWHNLTRVLKLANAAPETTDQPETSGDREPCDQQALLIVDDEEGICRLFKMILSAAFPKLTIDVMHNGAEGLESFEERHHAVVIMDLQMPIMDGTAAFRRIHKTCEKRNWEAPSVIFCTGFAPPAVVTKIVSTNHTHCLLTKPISGDDLILAVRKRLAE